MKLPTNPSTAAGAYALAQRLASPTGLEATKNAANGGSFADVLEATVGRARESGRRSDAMAMRAASGQPTDLVEVVTAVAESEAALETLVAVRDRVVAAYEDIMRMPI
jgi:flagellar hook-basal body complex protein FliE